MSDVVKKSEKVLKFSLRERLHFWLCDRLGVVPMHDFLSLDEECYLKFHEVHRRLWEIDNHLQAQKVFNVSVAKRLSLDAVNKDDVERGVL